MQQLDDSRQRQAEAPSPLPQHNTALVLVPAQLVEGMAIDTHLRFALQYTKFVVPDDIDDTALNEYRAQIVLEREDGPSEIVELSDDMMRRLFHYLRDPPQGVFDCGCFVQLMYDQEVTPDTFDFSKFERSEYAPDVPVPIGDAVVLYNDRTKEPLHFALSLGNDLYLFKTGWRASDRLTVGRFASMALVYGSDKAKVLHPMDT